MTMTHKRPIVAVLMAVVLVQVGCGDDAGKTIRPDVLDVTQTRPEETRVIEEIFDFFVDNGPVEYVPQEGEFLWECSTNEECISGFCVVTKEGGRCTTQCVEDCPAGWKCVEADTKPDLIYICVPRYLTLCDPCTTNDDCKQPGVDTAFLDLCLEHDDGAGSFCGADCSQDATSCPNGYACETVTTPGGQFAQCMPQDGQCLCSFLAVQEAKSTACVNTNEFGTCHGMRACSANGLSPCDATVPTEEKCDDLDNDCDEVIDEGCDDDDDGFCDAQLQTVGKPSTCGNGGGDCNDADVDVFPGATEKCDKKDNDCDGTIDNGLCDDGNPCTDDLCDPEAGCSHPFNAALCDDGNSCTVNDHCFEGACSGSQKVCDDANSCTTDLCDPVSEQGCYFVNNSDSCDDDGNACTIDVCENGACQHKLATDLPCDDGNPCTDGDMCKSGQCVKGGPKNCDDDDSCTADSCDQAQGCVNKVQVGTPCTYDLMVCQLPGTCGANGCVPQPNCQCPNCTLCVCCGFFQLCLDNIFGG
jgi:hypothetical protein